MVAGVVRQMLQKVEIDDAGETDLINGEQLDRTDGYLMPSRKDQAPPDLRYFKPRP